MRWGSCCRSAGWPGGSACALWTPVNLFQTLRGAYRSSILGAALKTLVVWWITVFSFTVLMIGLLVLAGGRALIFSVRVGGLARFGLIGLYAQLMADRVRLLAAAALAGALSACAPAYGPPPPGRMPAMPVDDSVFRAGDFAWSQAPGKNTLAGALGPPGPCATAAPAPTAVLTPGGPWPRRR